MIVTIKNVGVAIRRQWLTEYSVEGILGREYSVEEFSVEEFWVEGNFRSNGILGRGILGRREFWVEQKLPRNIKKSKLGCSDEKILACH